MATVTFADETTRLCHDSAMSCYHRWTVYGERPVGLKRTLITKGYYRDFTPEELERVSGDIWGLSADLMPADKDYWRGLIICLSEQLRSVLEAQRD